MSDAHAHTHDHDDMPAVHSGDVEHATPRTYYMIGFILTAITGLEVALFYIKAVEHFLVPMLLILSVVKFVTVVQFFMHLKYDSKVLSRVFFGPLMLACVVVIGMIMLFKVLPKFAW